jgi:hypothetical protein
MDRSIYNATLLLTRMSAAATNVFHERRIAFDNG